MLGAVVLLLFRPFSLEFYALYVLCGLSDIADGFVARRTKAQSKTGAMLDSVADLLFVGVCLFRFFPVLFLPIWQWIWIALIAALRIGNMAMGRVLHGRMIVLHTVANKATGGMLFLLPLLLKSGTLIMAVTLVCTAASFAAVQESRYIQKGGNSGA